MAEGVHHVAQAKQEGVKVTAETCPHYLFFDEQDFEEVGPALKCAPPLRSRENVNALWDLVLRGEVDVIQSDHSPCTWEEKAQGMDNIWQAWGGILGIQGMLPVALTEGVHARNLALTDVVRMMSANPARLMGLYPRKGAIQPGSDADFTIVDLDESWTFTKDDILSKNKHSGFEGRNFKGRVLKTFVRGTLVYDQGEIVAPPGHGMLLKREHPYQSIA
ncbi:MAG: amidohydrolase family protein [Chloroflexota bacterium]|nr:amidohydrolase family protein [Chloroflexota bacterium]